MPSTLGDGGESEHDREVDRQKAYREGYARGVEDAQRGQDERRPKRQGRVRMTVDGRAKDSYAEIYVPVEEVVGGLHNFMESGDKPIVLEQFYSNGDGVRVTLQRLPKEEPAKEETGARTRLPPGVYWTRSRDPKYKGVSLSELSGAPGREQWYEFGVEGGSPYEDCEVIDGPVKGSEERWSSTASCLTAVGRAGFRVVNNVLGTPTLWCVECGRGSGSHHSTCSKVDEMARYGSSGIEYRNEQLANAIDMAMAKAERVPDSMLRDIAAALRRSPKSQSQAAMWEAHDAPLLAGKD